MKKFSVNCDFGGQIAPFTICIGQCESTHHPLHFQADWLSKTRGGVIPSEVMEAISKLKDLAEKNNVLLEELCVYALGAAHTENEENEIDESNEEDSSLQLDDMLNDEYLIDKAGEEDAEEVDDAIFSDQQSLQEEKEYENDVLEATEMKVEELAEEKTKPKKRKTSKKKSDKKTSEE